MGEIPLPILQRFSVQPFSIVKIGGRPTAKPYRITINFFGEALEDKVFFINPCFDSKKIAFRTRIKGKYVSEENAPMVLAPGKDFLMEILATPCNFEVTVNGKFLHIHRQRLPCTAIRQLEISNNVSGGRGPSLELDYLGIEAYVKKELIFVLPSKQEDTTSHTAAGKIREGNVIQFVSRAANPGALRIRKSVKVDAKGGTGKKSQFVVVCANPGEFSFRNVKDPSWYLAIRDGTLATGKGGPFCSYKIADPIGTGEYIYLESCQYPDHCLAINEFGHPIPPQTNKGSPQAHFSVRLVNDPEKEPQKDHAPPPPYQL